MTAMSGQADMDDGGPSPRSIGPPGWSTYEALSALVDNSVEARGDGGVRIQVDLDYAAKSIRVSDDGAGMDSDELLGAVSAAASAQQETGAHRLDMGSACSFLGRSFSVSSSRAGSGLEHVVECSEQRRDGGAAQPGRYGTSCASRKKDDMSAHGTSILVASLRVPLYAGQTTLFKRRLGERHCDYIREGQAKIRINSVECEPAPPATADGSVRRFELGASGRAAGWIGLLRRRPGAGGGGGLSLYRGSRLVEMRSRFGMRGRPGEDRLVGRVSLDHIPAGPGGAGFAEDSAEYLEAERAFMSHPAVGETLQNHKQAAGAGGVDFDHFYDYLLGRRDDPATIGQRMGRLASEALLASMPRLETEVDGRAVTVECADAGGPPYERHETGGGVRYVINRGSPVFGAVKNPLYVVALVGADLRVAGAGPAGKSAPALREHHAAWASIVDGLARGRAPRAARPEPAAGGYSLSENLAKLRSVLEDCYYDKFEFTGLSTLVPYTHNALASPVYSLYTEREHGEYLCDVIMDFCTGYVPLFNPDGRDIDMWRYASGGKHLVAVREYSASELSGPIAPPAKAWMDLVREVRLHHMPYMEDDLASILDMLKCLRMLSLRDLDVIARRRKSEHARGLIEQVFAV